MANDVTFNDASRSNGDHGDGYENKPTTVTKTYNNGGYHIIITGAHQNTRSGGVDYYHTMIREDNPYFGYHSEGFLPQEATFTD